MMRKELADVFTECNEPTHACRQAVNDQLRPVAQLAALTLQQVALHRMNLLTAELTADDPDKIRGHLERMHQTIDALEKDAKGAIEHQRRMSLGMSQLARYSKEIEEAIVKEDAEELVKEKVDGG